jgi:hypothetical protein
MSKETLKSKKWLVVLSASLLLCALIAVPAALTSAQNTKGEKQTEKKKPTLREAVTKKSPSEIEAKPGFELVLKGESGFTVRRASTKEIVGSVGCSICPGGKCHAKIIGGGGGACRGCGSSTGRDCTYDPF